MSYLTNEEIVHNSRESLKSMNIIGQSVPGFGASHLPQIRLSANFRYTQSVSSHLKILIHS